MAVRIGTRFHAVLADANVEWRVTAKLGRGVWEATCIDEDYGGSTRAFRAKDIEAAKAIDKMWADNRRKHGDFYAGLKVGQIVHYFNGFKEFVRCEVVEGTKEDMEALAICQAERDRAKAEKMLKPIALVGEWREWDLRPDSYHVRGIEEGRPFKPNVTCIYEAEDYAARKRSIDPRGLEPIKLTGGQLKLAIG